MRSFPPVIRDPAAAMLTDEDHPDHQGDGRGEGVAEGTVTSGNSLPVDPEVASARRGDHSTGPSGDQEERLHGRRVDQGGEPDGQRSEECGRDPGGDHAGDDDRTLQAAMLRLEQERKARGLPDRLEPVASEAPGLHTEYSPGTHRELTREPTREPTEHRGELRDTEENGGGGRARARDFATPSCAWHVRSGEGEAVRAVEEGLDVGAADWVLRAVERNNREHEARSRTAEDDRHAKGFNRKLYRSPSWRLVSELRGHPTYGSMEVWQAVQAVEELLEPHGGWVVLPDCDIWKHPDDPRDAFIEAWQIQEEEDVDPLAVAVEPAEAVPLVERHPLMSDRWPSDADATYRRTVGICYWFARLLGQEGSFFLSCRTLGDLLDVSHTQAAKLLKRAVREGLLAVEEEGGGGPGGDATRYTFDLAAVRFAEGAAEADEEARTHPARAVGEGAR